MTRRKWVFVGVLVVCVLLVLYVLIAKPTLVLPTITIALPKSSPLIALKEQIKSNELHLVLRTDGKAFFVSDGKELAQVDYTPATLGNTVRIAQKTVVSPETNRIIRFIPLVFPDLIANAMSFGSTAFYVLPLEITFRFIPS